MENMFNFGYFIRNSEDNYTVLINKEKPYSGYNVISKDIDAYNNCNLDEVKAYGTEHPEMELPQWPIPQAPTTQELWEQLKADDFSPLTTTDEQKAFLYQNLRYKLIGDVESGELDMIQPFLETLTADEMSQKYLHYIGDNEEKALSYMVGKLEAKKYIRSLFQKKSI
jgi:hypothetical protein